jgi:transposase
VRREDLVAERTGIINRLRWHLVDLCPELKASIPSRHLDRPRRLQRIARRLALERSARVRVAAELVRRVRELTRARLDPEARTRRCGVAASGRARRNEGASE